MPHEFIETTEAPEQPMSERIKTMSLEEMAGLAEIDLDVIRADIRERWEILHRKTEVLQDEMRCISLGNMVFDYYEDLKPEKAFSHDEKRTFKIGEFCSDDGKSGPKGAPKDVQESITDIYTVKNTNNLHEEKNSLRTFIYDHFFKDAKKRIALMESIGLDLNTPMRTFWNMHTQWTLDIIKGDGVPPEAVAGAATHHILEGINPDHIVGEHEEISERYGHGLRFNRVEKLIILIDKYDAVRFRGKRSHQDAIDFVRNAVHRNLHYEHDGEFNELIDDMDIALENTDLYQDSYPSVELKKAA